jgi:hypothetical protein
MRRKEKFCVVLDREKKNFQLFPFHPSEKAEIAGEKRFFAVSGSTKGRPIIRSG